MALIPIAFQVAPSPQRLMVAPWQLGPDLQFFEVLVFEPRALCLLSRHSTTQATLPASLRHCFRLFCFQVTESAAWV
jgi:hypothetical protein